MNIKEHGSIFHRFEAIWTPTVLVMSPKGVERLRNEGYLPQPEFTAFLEMGLGRVAFMAKRWDEAGQHYENVIQRFPNTSVVPEAIYWRGVCLYSGKGDHEALGQVRELLKQYPDSPWAAKSQVW